MNITFKEWKEAQSKKCVIPAKTRAKEWKHFLNPTPEERKSEPFVIEEQINTTYSNYKSLYLETTRHLTNLVDKNSPHLQTTISFFRERFVAINVAQTIVPKNNFVIFQKNSHKYKKISFTKSTTKLIATFLSIKKDTTKYYNGKDQKI